MHACVRARMHDFMHAHVCMSMDPCVSDLLHARMHFPFHSEDALKRASRSLRRQQPTAVIDVSGLSYYWFRASVLIGIRSARRATACLPWLALM